MWQTFISTNCNRNGVPDVLRILRRIWVTFCNMLVAVYLTKMISCDKPNDGAVPGHNVNERMRIAYLTLNLKKRTKKENIPMIDTRTLHAG